MAKTILPPPARPTGLVPRGGKTYMGQNPNLGAGKTVPQGKGEGSDNDEDDVRRKRSPRNSQSSESKGK